MLADNATSPTWYTHYAVVDFAALVYLVLVARSLLGRVIRAT